jgi:hypothetical protein
MSIFINNREFGNATGSGNGDICDRAGAWERICCRNVAVATRILFGYCLAVKLINALPFQSLDDLEYDLNITRGRTFSQDDMDRITQLSFNPFQLSNDLELCGISAHPDLSFDIDKIKCDYYLTNELKDVITKDKQKNYFSLLHLNIRSVSKNFDSFKHLLNSLGKPIKVIGL